MLTDLCADSMEGAAFERQWTMTVSSYQIRVRGYLDAKRAAWFDGMTLTHEGQGVTLIAGPVVDQAALHGLLARVRDLGLVLVSVIRVEDG
jgi:hypothetical protein